MERDEVCGMPMKNSRGGRLDCWCIRENNYEKEVCKEGEAKKRVKKKIFSCFAYAKKEEQGRLITATTVTTATAATTMIYKSWS